MMNAALATHFFISLNEPISNKRIAFEQQLFNKTKCFSATMSTLFHTQSHPTMSICTKISFR